MCFGVSTIGALYFQYKLSFYEAGVDVTNDWFHLNEHNIPWCQSDSVALTNGIGFNDCCTINSLFRSNSIKSCPSAAILAISLAFLETLNLIVSVIGSTIGLKLSERGQIGVKIMAFTE